jgi:hypothetical protein
LKVKSLILLFCFLSIVIASLGQHIKLHGTVYDFFTKRPLDAVSVQTSTGVNTITYSLGNFTISVTNNDSVWFTYLYKKTIKYPIDTITNPSNFEIALYVEAAWLPAVKVKSNNYILDSMQNRIEYAKVFNFKKPGLKFTSSPSSSYVPGSFTAGIDLDELINSFRFRRNRELQSMQERLIKQEQEKYINHRYTKYSVERLTSLSGKDLDSFIMISKPSYELLLTMNDIELGYYIQQFYKLYKANNRDSIFQKKAEESQ